MERKFRYGICQNGMEWKISRMEWKTNLPYFHTNSILHFVHFLQKNTYRCRVVINTVILSQKYSTSISTRIICRQIAVLGSFILRKQCTYCIIASIYIAVCSIDVIVDDFDKFDFFFEIDYLPSPKFCFFTSSRKLVFAISFPFQLNFIYIFSFSAYNNSFWC